jgi:hypothetical protein
MGRGGTDDEHSEGVCLHPKVGPWSAVVTAAGYSTLHIFEITRNFLLLEFHVKLHVAVIKMDTNPFKRGFSKVSGVRPCSIRKTRRRI